MIFSAVFMFCFAAMLMNSDSRQVGISRDDEATESPKPYSFGYNMSDANGALQHRQEVANEKGEVRGSYGFTDSNGTYRRVDYVANSREGFRVKIDSNEPGIIKQNINPNILYE